MSKRNPFASELLVNEKPYHIFSLKKAAETFGDINRLPFSLKILLENLLRNLDDDTVTTDEHQ